MATDEVAQAFIADVAGLLADFDRHLWYHAQPGSSAAFGRKTTPYDVRPGSSAGLGRKTTPYQLDLRGYQPVEVAAALGKPMLILQGGRDYQVTVADDLAGWKAGLAHSPNVTITIYEPDNHLFFSGTGPSAPAENEPAQHMDPAVIADIASWLTTVVDSSDVSTKELAR